MMEPVCGMHLDMWFDRWGYLPWLEPEDYWQEPWDYVGPDFGEDGCPYDIVIKGRDMAYTYI